MQFYLGLFVCLAVAVPSVLSLGCCIPELVTKIKSMCVKGVLEQQKSFSSYDVCILSKSDSEIFRSVIGDYISESVENQICEYLQVTVDRKQDPTGIVKRTYDIKDNGDCTYQQTDRNSGETFVLLPIASTEHYASSYGCKTTEPCEGSQFVQCSFPRGTDHTYHAECQTALNNVVKGYIDTVDVCDSQG